MYKVSVRFIVLGATNRVNSDFRTTGFRVILEKSYRRSNWNVLCTLNVQLKRRQRNKSCLRRYQHKMAFGIIINVNDLRVMRMKDIRIHFRHSVLIN